MLLTFALRLVIYQEFIHTNPFSQAFFSDDWVYWVMAGGKAAGNWIDPGPFLSAPLYPFLLGGLRSLGLDLPAIFFLQLLLGVISTGLIAIGARQRYGEFTALLAAILFAFAEEPVLSFTKIMADSSQLFLIILVWFVWRKLLDRDQPCWVMAALLGILIGLLCLIWPPAQLLIPVLVISYFLRFSNQGSCFYSNILASRRALQFSLISLIMSLLIIAPVTWHNYKTDHSFILISANSGINLLQGNHPNSEGYITPIDGIRTDRQNMFADAKQRYDEAHEQSANWKTIDAYYGDQAKSFILNNPAESIPLFFKKFYWFISSYDYDNIGIRKFEKELGLYQTSWLAPIALPWLMGLTFLGFIFYIKSLRHYLPEFALLGLTVFVCVLFHYSARYRLPAAPFLCLATALTISNWKQIPLPRAINFSFIKFVIALLPVFFLIINQQTGFAHVDFLRSDTAPKVSQAYLEAGDRAYRNEQFDQADSLYQKASAADPSYLSPQLRQYYLRDQHAEAISTAPDFFSNRLSGKFASHPDLLRHQFNIALRTNNYSQAIEVLNRLIVLEPRDRDFQKKLFWLISHCITKPDTSSLSQALSLARDWLGQSRGDDRIDAYIALAIAQHANQQFSRATKSLNTAKRLAERHQSSIQIDEIKSLADQFSKGEQPDCKITPFNMPSPVDLTKPHPMDFINFK